MSIILSFIWILLYLNVQHLLTTPYHIINSYTRRAIDCGFDPIQLYTYHGQTSHQVRLNHVTDDWYQIQCVSGDQCLELISDAGTIVSELCDASYESQKFKFIAVGHNEYIIVSAENSKFLSANSDTLDYLTVEDCYASYEKWVITQKDQELENGEYWMINVNSDKALALVSPGEQLVQKTFSSTSTLQAFLFVHSDGEYYQIKAQNGHCLKTFHNTQNTYYEIYASACMNHPTQKWHFVDLGNEEYNIRVASPSDWSLDVPEGSKSENKGLIVWSNTHFGDHQIFKLVPVELQDGYYYIQSKHDEYNYGYTMDCLFGTEVSLWHPHRDDYQKLKIEGDDNGKYTIKCVHDGLYFTVRSDGKLELRDHNPQLDQLFEFVFEKTSGDEVYQIRSATGDNSGKLIEIPGVSWSSYYPAMGQQLGVFTSNGGNHQKWKLWPYTYDESFVSDDNHDSSGRKKFSYSACDFLNGGDVWGFHFVTDSRFVVSLLFVFLAVLLVLNCVWCYRFVGSNLAQKRTVHHYTEKCVVSE